MASFEEIERRNADNIEKMRNDEDSDWHHRVLETMTKRFPVTCLTPPEKMVLQYASYGLETPHIVDLTGLSRWTVRSHFQNGQRKLLAKNRAHAVAIALRNDLIV
jgi:DNA-binding CsgD family transcriptional regulator